MEHKDRDANRTRRIRELNDELRIKRRTTLGLIMLTKEVRDFVRNDQTISPHNWLERSQILLDALAEFDSFTPDNDPYGEHDGGTFTLWDREICFKIDYFDLSLLFHSEDPANPAKTRRILTIGFAGSL